MDDRSFDRLARLLGEARDRRTGLKALVGGILGAGGLAALDTDADARRKGRGRKDASPDAERRKKKKKKKCNPGCDAGFACVRGRCTCASGIACAGACCGAGQVCRNGACADPLPACLPFGAACKDTGRACCDGLSCASGQDGSYPVTCLRAKGAACASTDECPFGMSCTDGSCLGDGAPGVPTGASCAGGESCAQPGATCGAYTTPGAPGGEFCTLPLRKVCTGNPDCSCYNCWYVQDGVDSVGRQGRAAPVKQCIQPTGGACSTDADCALGLECNLGTGRCGAGTQCAPSGAPCGGSVSCCQGSTCENGTCSGGGGKQVGDACTPGDTCPTGSTCTASSDPAKAGEGTKCLLNDGETSVTAANCKGNGLYDGKCVTCTVYYTSGNDTASFSALKTALEAAAATPTDTTKNPVYVGAGTYMFTNPDQFEGALYLRSAQKKVGGTAVQIFACGNGTVTFDGGSTVTFANTTTLPAGSEWSGGQGLLQLGYLSPADYNDSAGFEIDGIDFQNGRNPKTGSKAGAIGTEVDLTLRNAKISRCTGPAGGVYATGDVLNLKNVEIRQCYGTDPTRAGGIYGQNLITLENIKVFYNSGVTGAVGGISLSMNSAGESATLKGTVEIQNNGASGVFAGAQVVNCTAVTSAAGSICGNPTSGATGATNCDGSATFTGCDSLCKGTPKNTTNSGAC